jgi:hypothetical protein
MQSRLLSHDEELPRKINIYNAETRPMTTVTFDFIASAGR